MNIFHRDTFDLHKAANKIDFLNIILNPEHYYFLNLYKTCICERTFLKLNV